MKESLSINQKVVVSAVTFDRQLETVPRRMEYRGTTYHFVESGLKCLVRSGERMVRIITMSDGAADYRLRQDSSEYDWTLLSISPLGGASI